MKKRIAVISVVLLIAGAISYSAIVFSNSPIRAVQKQLRLGKQYLVELQYEEAAACFYNAIQLDPNNTEAASSLQNTVIEWSESLASAGDYENAIAKLVDAESVLGSADSIDGSLSALCDQYAQNLMRDGEYEETLQLLNQYKAYIPEKYDSLIEQTYLQWGDSFVKENNYQQAILIMEDAQNEYPLNDTYASQTTKYYNDWFNELLGAQEYEGASILLDQVNNYFTEDELESMWVQLYLEQSEHMGIDENAQQVSFLLAGIKKIRDNEKLIARLEESLQTTVDYLVQAGNIDKALEIVNEAYDVAPSSTIEKIAADLQQAKNQQLADEQPMDNDAAAAPEDGNIIDTDEAAAPADGNIIDTDEAAAPADGNIIDTDEAAAPVDDNIIDTDEAAPPVNADAAALDYITWLGTPAHTSHTDLPNGNGDYTSGGGFKSDYGMITQVNVHRLLEGESLAGITMNDNILSAEQKLLNQGYTFMGRDDNEGSTSYIYMKDGFIVGLEVFNYRHGFNPEGTFEGGFVALADDSIRYYYDCLDDPNKAFYSTR